jgi:hypothetical protein
VPIGNIRFSFKTESKNASKLFGEMINDYLFCSLRRTSKRCSLFIM